MKAGVPVQSDSFSVYVLVHPIFIVHQLKHPSFLSSRL